MKASIRSICFTGMFAGVLSVLSILNIPTPWGVPFTLQTFAVSLTGFVLEKKYGTCATGLYLLLGLVGLPVYTGMKAGPAVLFGPTGGYLIGFLFMAFLCGLGMEAGRKKNKLFTIPLALLGLLCCHFFGLVQFKLYSGMTWGAAVLAASAPYLLKDVLSVAGAYAAALVLCSALRSAHLRYDD